MKGLFVCACVMCLNLGIYTSAMSACRMIEHPDRVEIDCSEAGQTSDATDIKKTEDRIDKNNKNFYFNSPEKDGTKISIFANLNNNVTANPDDTIFAMYYEDSRLGMYSVKSYKYKSRTGNDTFSLEESNDIMDKKTNPINVYLDTNNAFQLPSSVVYSGCSPKESFVYLKTFKLEGNRLNYQLILSECLQKKLLVRGE